MNTSGSIYKRFLTIAAYLGFVVLALSTPKASYAAACTGLPGIGNTTLSNCTLTVSATTGIDQANNIELSTSNTAVLTAGAGASITINSGGTIAVGSIVLNGGTIAIDNGGTTKPSTTLYVADADGDGWADSLSNVVTSTSAGVRRFSLMRSSSTADCNSGAFSTSNTCLIADGGACTADNQCVSSICGANADSDSFFSLAAGHTGTCQASALPYTDCYDSNANAYPSSTYCSASHRGDGSYDYNCSSTESTCGTVRNYSCSSTQLTNDYCSGNSCAANTVTGYLANSTSCGQVGCTCSSTGSRGTSCSDVGGLYPSCSVDSSTSYCSAVASGSQTCQ